MPPTPAPRSRVAATNCRSAALASNTRSWWLTAAVSSGVMRVRVLGVDPGLTRCGMGVVDGSAGAGISLVDVTVVRTGVDDDLGQRLRALELAFTRWLAEHRPDAIAVERVFSQHNVSTVMGTAQAGAVAVLAAARAGVPVALHT